MFLKKQLICIPLVITGLIFTAELAAQSSFLGLGWAKNSVNGVIFRRNSVVSHKGEQYVSYYDSSACVILAKRLTGSDKWQVQKTPYTGDVNDAHRSISMMVDGDGSSGQGNLLLNRMILAK